jgi:Fe-S-cluster containining protein
MYGLAAAGTAMDAPRVAADKEWPPPTGSNGFSERSREDTLPSPLPIANNEDAATCAACGGKCYKTLPGAYLPGQLGEDELAAGIRAGRLVLAWWDGDPRPDRNCLDVDCDGTCPKCRAEDRLQRAYYVRPRNVNSPPGPFDGTHQGACTLLGPRGCTLPFERRPSGCQNLLVNRADPGNCDEYAVPTRSFKHYAAEAWVPHQALLRRLAAPPSAAST